MKKKQLPIVEIRLDKIVGGGQALGTLPDGRKLFAWGGLPGERVNVQLTKKKSSFAEGIVTDVLEPSVERIQPTDKDSYLSTSPWQIMTFEAEQRYKSLLIKEAFELHDMELPGQIHVRSDGRTDQYRNKVEFSWYGDNSSGVEKLHLAFFRRGSKGKIAVDDSALLPPEVMILARTIRDALQSYGVTGRELKTLLIRCDAEKNCVWQLYVKDKPCVFADQILRTELPAQGGEVIFSTPKSPASVITERLGSSGDIVLSDTILDIPFRYATEGFFQVNLPVYEQALLAMQKWIPEDRPVVDLYSGVGSIGLTIGGPNVTLVEINEHAVREMRRNIEALGSSAKPVLAASEQALDYITGEETVIVDPPRAGLHADVVQRLIETKPAGIIYLSCNPVTQARDIALLSETYKMHAYEGFNFFPRTPHIEGLAILDLR